MNLDLRVNLEIEGFKDLKVTRYVLGLLNGCAFDKIVHDVNQQCER